MRDHLLGTQPRTQQRFIGTRAHARGAVEGIEVAGRMLAAPKAALSSLIAFTLGVRPEYVRIAPPNEAGAVPGVVTQAQDIGTYWLVTARCGNALVRARLGAEARPPAVGEPVWLKLIGARTCFYRNDELIAA